MLIIPPAPPQEDHEDQRDHQPPDREIRIGKNASCERREIFCRVGRKKTKNDVNKHPRLDKAQNKHLPPGDIASEEPRPSAIEQKRQRQKNRKKDNDFDDKDIIEFDIPRYHHQRHGVEYGKRDVGIENGRNHLMPPAREPVKKPNRDHREYQNQIPRRMGKNLRGRRMNAGNRDIGN